jgi:hypothetical protein
MFAPQTPMEQIAAGYDRAVEIDLRALTPDELEAELRAVVATEAQAYAHAVRVRAEFAQRGPWPESGALSAGAHVAACTRAPSRRTNRQFSDAARLAELPAVLVALDAGAIGQWHAELLLKIDNPRTHDALVADQVQLVRWAMAETWREFTRKVFAWVEEVDPDGPEPSVEKRDAKIGRDLDGTARLTATLTRVGAEIAITEHKRLEKLLHHEDLAEARCRLGREPNHDELRRTNAQRRHDALVLAFERSATSPDDGRRGQPLFLALVGEQSFVRTCELASGTPLRPGELAPYVGEATIQSILFDGPFTAVAATDARTFRGKLKRAGQAIQRECPHPYCDKPIEECVGDHYLAHSLGGETGPENHIRYCDGHNHMKAAMTPEQWEAQLPSRPGTPTNEATHDRRDDQDRGRVHRSGVANPASGELVMRDPPSRSC